MQRQWSLVHLLTTVLLLKAMLFSSGHVWMWELDHKESWAPKNWCFWTVVLEKTLESPFPKGNQSLIFIGSTDVESETPVVWPSDVKKWLIWKDPDAGKDWRHVLLFATPWTVALQAPLSMGFPRQCWCGLPFPFPGDPPYSGAEPMSPALQSDLYHWASWEAHYSHSYG